MGNIQFPVVMMSFKLPAVFGLVGIFYVWRRSRATRYPPGPTPTFLTGNIRDIPSGGSEWVQYRDLSRKHGGDVIYLNILGSHLVVLNSVRAANDLLDQRRSLYSSRPRMVVIKELRGWDWNVVFMSYGEALMAHRRVIQQEFQPRIVENTYQPIITRECKMLLANLLHAPDNFVAHLKSFIAAEIVMIAYGHQIESDEDVLVKIAEEVRVSTVDAPPPRLVELLPLLKYIPEWFPGAHFKRYARLEKSLALRMRQEPHDLAKEKIAAGVAIPCITSRLIEALPSPSDVAKDELIMNCTGSIYNAGVDTTTISMTNFILAMILHPEIQQKARAEIDAVVGRDRLPDFSDRGSMPFMDCILKEVLRWKPVTPLGVPHATTDNDIYRGMFIPKNTTVLPNVWAMLHDPEVYYDPEEFIPERFLQTEIRDP